MDVVSFSAYNPRSADVVVRPESGIQANGWGLGSWNPANCSTVLVVLHRFGGRVESSRE
jgi:hypothetical protein